MVRFFGLMALSISLFIPNSANAAKDKETRVTRNRIEISGKVLFETGSAQIQSRSHALLKQVAQVLKENPDIPDILIAGHTDDVGDAQQNKKLSAQRADSVKKYLVSLGVPNTRLATAGYGESRPRALGKSKQARTTNRRVEFVLIRPFTVSADAGLIMTMASGADGVSGTTGIMVGATGHYAVMDILTADLGLQFAQRGASSDAGDLKMSFIDVPITATYSGLPPLGPVMPHVGAGLMFSLPLSASFEGESAESAMQTGLVMKVGGAYEVPIGSVWSNIRYVNALSSASPDVDGVKLHSLTIEAGLTF